MRPLVQNEHTVLGHEGLDLAHLGSERFGHVTSESQHSPAGARGLRLPEKDVSARLPMAETCLIVESVGDEFA